MQCTRSVFLAQNARKDGLTIEQTNSYFQIMSPWRFKDSISEEIAQLKVNRPVYHSVEAVRIIGILLQPFMPEKSSELLDLLGVDERRRSFDHARFGADHSYGTPKISVGKDVWDNLFPPLPVE
jgi:methionyl-tRNA synthetase